MEEAASYAVGHRIRIEILAVLHEGPASVKELSEELRQPLSTVIHHVDELLSAGSIELARTGWVGNVKQSFYRVTELPAYSSEEYAALTAAERQATCSLILQSTMAEALASLWAGKMHSDLLLQLAWDRILLDEQGRREAAEEQTNSWERLHDIAAQAAGRLARSDEGGTTHVIVTMGFERSRTSAPAIGEA